MGLEGEHHDELIDVRITVELAQVLPIQTAEGLIPLLLYRRVPVAPDMLHARS